jgi:two-component system nitrogen regulation response regulator NtrX
MARRDFGVMVKQTATMKILIVDDEEIVRLTLSAMIDHMGHTAKCVNDGLAGKQALKNNKYDAAFVDIRMPGLDGMNLLKWSRQQQLDLPIIIMSGHGAEDSRAEALRSGAFAFLTKPFSLVGIKDLIEKIQKNVNAATV